MKLLFVRSNKLGSRLICWGLEEPISHVACDTLTPAGIFHSYKTGIVPISHEDFNSLYTVVDRLTLPIPAMYQEKASDIFLSYISPHYQYDYAGLAYFAFRAALRKFFRVPYPKYNQAQVAENFLCTEVAYLAAYAYADVTGKNVLAIDTDLAMLTPLGLCRHIRNELHAQNPSLELPIHVGLRRGR